MVVVDRFSKYATFVASPADCTVEEAARLFLKNMVKYWGLPKVIVSDRDPRFTGKFWMELFKLLGSELHFSTSFRPQTDGQTERVNALLECYLRHFVSANQADWAAQFSYNLMRSEATNQSPFEIIIGQQLLTPLALVWERAEEFVPGRFDLEGPIPNETNTDFRYIPFSGGPRKCVGDQFALLEAIVALAIFLQHMNFELVPGKCTWYTRSADLELRNILLSEFPRWE
ncbi:hypothetical protein RJ639_023925 [Escallonia herrerae]|uniref:Integrase catalytic domain-containing protein n=1 Tax=Escallonia herrerae TaxID=1293975 RepID=A0AA88UZE5_9ASTE|nr:hypothetical protein RJ639_023925 [Escallonia herrerae]